MSFTFKQDVQWNDLDYMERYLDFTLGSDFATLPDMIEDLHAHDQRYVMIVVRPLVSLPVAVVCLRVTPLAMFGSAGSGYQQHTAAGLILALRRRAEEGRLHQRR